MKPLSLAFSPCPNDTHIFSALVNGDIDTQGVLFQKPLLEDVETLNEWAIEHRHDVTKLSFHALGHVLDEYCVLGSGAALGRGCGPLLVARNQCELGDGRRLRVAIPGRLTTAALLFRLYLPACDDLVPMRFDRIMAAVAGGEVDAGVIIHESRFTYAGAGLSCLCDLGQWWEQTTGLAIPLGCIAARRSLGEVMLSRIDRLIGLSLSWAGKYPDRCLPYIRQHAQEMDDQVMTSHIQLYVNDFSKNLGKDGRAAVSAFLQRGRDAGVLPHWPEGLQVFSGSAFASGQYEP